jgi:16S rRNA (cytosine967-C5)-methyltransferase
VTTGTGLPARRAALRALHAVEEEGAWSNTAVPVAVADLAEERDRAFASHLAYDTLRWEGTLDWALATVLTRPLGAVEPPLRRILRLGALQLLRSGVPPRAAVDTGVALAREQVPGPRATGAASFVNGVLRQLARRIDELPWPDADEDPIGSLVLRTAHPSWVVLDLVEQYGIGRAGAILAADDRPPGLTLRAVGDRDALLAELLSLGVDARAGSVAEAVLAPGGDPRRLAAVAEGRAVPQDEASMRVAHATGAGPGDRVLDLCAGPGGKSTHLASLVAPSGAVVAVELHEHRAALIRAAAVTQGVEVEVLVGDALALELAEQVRFDRVLLDAPCTGLGTGRRRPEVRWRRTPEDAVALGELQERLLAAAAERVGPGGVLTYSVCTWTARETTQVAERFDAGPSGAAFVPIVRQQLLPDRDGTDGMFIATWRRTDAAGRGDDQG